MHLERITIISELEVYVALSPHWQDLRQIRKNMVNARREEGKIFSRVSRADLAVRLMHLVDSKRVEEKTEPLIIDFIPLRVYYYRLTSTGYNEKREIVEGVGRPYKSQHPLEATI